ncbi:Rpn family recombination-promoting nuclease/putative transposase [Nocardia rhizosphaerihabitans]|uniref:Rpn family recombination-promoting nuclease/putative transposase n=1 Tax=Nocardia rhizosphaerihabitans TaxID=1691570 RepID=UPI00366C22F7
MVSPPSNPHDAYFRCVMARPADAASEIRAALPATITARLDLTTLRLQPGSFVSRELRSRYSDLLYSVEFDGRDAYVYVLIEHQSGNDRFMALRMLEYVVNIWAQYRREHPATEVLPPVIPLVVHSGHASRWTAPTELRPLFDLDAPTYDLLHPYLPQFSFLLDDVAALDLAALRARDLTPATRVMLVLHKIAPGSAQLGDDMLELIEDLQAMEADPNVDLRPTFSYILIVGDTPEEDLDPVIEQLGPRAKEAIVTTAERLRAEGEARGEARGKAQGRAEGRAEMLIEQLVEKFGAVPAEMVARVRAADLDRLREWTRRVLTADTLDEIFA